jgi:hypothetical protein
MKKLLAILIIALLFSCQKDPCNIPDPVVNVNYGTPIKLLRFNGANGFKQITYYFMPQNNYQKVIYFRQSGPCEEWIKEEVNANYPNQ